MSGANTLQRRELKFKYCECGCKCYTAKGLRDSYSIFSDLKSECYYLRINNGDSRGFAGFTRAMLAAEQNETRAFQDYAKGK